MTKFQFPTLDLSEIDLPKRFDQFRADLPTADKVATFTKNVGYAYLGALTVVAERVEAATKDMQARATEARQQAVADTRERMEEARKAATDLGDKVVELVKDSVAKVRAGI